VQAQYNLWIVALSYLVAVLASFVALDLASRVAANRGSAWSKYWLLGGAVMMGGGIWSMHFVGMLAFSLPIPVPYSVPVTALSFAFATIAAYIALHTVSQGTLGMRRLVVAGLVMGGGVALMHYTGMAALEIRPLPTYHPVLFVLSIVIAVVASMAAMWISFQLRSDTILTAFWKKSASAIVMGVAIWGMHFTAMAAAIFSPNSYCLGDPSTIDNKWLALTVGFCAFLCFATMLVVSVLDARLSLRGATLQAESERFFNQSLNLLCTAGFDGHFKRLNPAWERVLGTSRAQLMAKPFLDVVHPEDHAPVIAAMQKLARGEVVISVECRCRRADGTYRDFLWDATPFNENQGFYATGHDITERKAAEVELRSTHERLIEASRVAGMAEVATNVLHNVGNVLNSVNVSAQVAIDLTRKSKTADLERVVTLLQEHQGDLAAFMKGPKGAALLPFLAQLAQCQRSDQETTIRELELLRTNLDHIKEIVAMQQSAATRSGATETVRVADLVEDSLRLNAGTLTRHHIAVVREYGEVPEVALQKHKVLQILVNLIRNAKFACVESGRIDDRRVVVRIEARDGWLRVSVSDNGVGIAPETLGHIFGRGFTTRKDGHGFGLHSGALAAREMGGTLKVHSDGPMKGATFTLELPLPQPVAARARPASLEVVA
jgi:PAS domain S-box-containing protein